MGNIIKNGGTLVVASMLLGGCGLPVGVTIASWAADGISYVATDKTLTEHGISAVAGKDCSVWRMFKGGNFCVEWKDGEKPTIVAQNDQGQVDELGFDYDGVILNAAAYTHTSVGIGDAIKGIQTPVVEVHISNIHAREEFRQHSYISPNANGVLFGFGLKGYELALDSFL